MTSLTVNPFAVDIEFNTYAVVFEDGQTQAVIPYTIVADGVAEQAESAWFSIIDENITGATFTSSVAEIEIAQSVDAGGYFGFDDNTLGRALVVSEPPSGQIAVTFTVQRWNTVSTAPVTVNWNLYNNSIAMNVQNFQGTVAFTAQDQRRDIVVYITADIVPQFETYVFERVCLR